MRMGMISLAGLVALLVAAVAGVGAAEQKPMPGNAASGKLVYDNAVPKCSLCHKVGNSGGKLGPDLSAVGTRRDAAWLLNYLPNPQAKDPKNKMPPVTAKGQELTDLVAYLRSLRGKGAGS